MACNNAGTTGRLCVAGQCVLSAPVTLAAAYYYVCAVRANGTVVCWGYNAQGQLGDGTTTQRTLPVQVIGLP